MSFFYILLVIFLTFSCSEDIEKNKAPKKNPLPIENKSVHSLNTQSKSFTNEHISGSSKPRISGAPSSSHLSGQ